MTRAFAEPGELAMEPEDEIEVPKASPGNHLGRECSRLIRELEAVLSSPEAWWDDLDGPLVYVDILARVAGLASLEMVTRERATAWKRRFLEVFDTNLEEESMSREFDARRRLVIVDAFDRLIARCCG
jgi:hypothetical protein